ncbi:MAG TPA: extracellular solute-binding protein [Chloroflexota bacterium]
MVQDASAGRGLWRQGLGGVVALLVLLAACGGGASAQSGKAASGAGGAQGQAPAASALTYTGADRQQKLAAAAQQEAALSWYTSLTIGVAQELARRFEAKYPPLKVDLFRAADNDIITKIVEEARTGKGVADVVEMPTPTLRIVKAQDLLAEYYLPNADAYPAAAKEPGSGQNIYWAVDREHYISFGYNTNLLPASAVPKDVQGLAAPALKNQMAIAGTTTGVNWVGFLATQEPPDLLGQIAQQNVKIQMISGTALLDLVAKGEIAASPTIFKAEVEIAQEKGAPVEWVPLVPVTANAGALAVLARAPHPNAAALFAEFLLGDEGQGYLKENHFGLAGTEPGFARWYPDQGMTGDQYEQTYETWKKRMTETFTGS